LPSPPYAIEPGEHLQRERRQTALLLAVPGLPHRLREGGIGMDRPGDATQADAVFHGHRDLVDQVSGAFPDQRRSEYPIVAPGGQDLHEALLLAVLEREEEGCVKVLTARC